MGYTESGFYFSPDGGASEGGETLKVRCQGDCDCLFHEDDLTLHPDTNSKLCPDCFEAYSRTDEEKAIETVHQVSMNDLSMDKLQTLHKLLREETDFWGDEFEIKPPMNVTWWLNTVKIAIESKKNKS